MASKRAGTSNGNMMTIVVMMMAKAAAVVAETRVVQQDYEIRETLVCAGRCCKALCMRSGDWDHDVEK